MIPSPMAGPFRILTVVDNWSRSSPILEARFRMSGESVSQMLDRVLSEGPAPRSITVDHGTDFQSRALEDWAYRRGVQLDFIRPGETRGKCLYRVVKRAAA
jgi:putative transposase